MAAAPPSRTFKIVTVWLLLGTAVFVAFQMWLAREAQAKFSMADGVITLERGRDGHYRWPGRVDGTPVVFLVDTGATSTTIPAAVAERAGLEAQGSFRSNTAGGVVTGRLSVADIELQGGVQAQRLRIGVLPELSTPLLGMDVLSKMRITQDGQSMRITAQR